MTTGLSARFDPSYPIMLAPFNVRPSFSKLRSVVLSAHFGSMIRHTRVGSTANHTVDISELGSKEQ
jgi:hypothetical protein